MTSITWKQKTQKWTGFALACSWYGKNHQPNDFCYEERAKQSQQFWFWIALDDVTCEIPHEQWLSVGGLKTPLETSVKQFLNQSKEQSDTPSLNDSKAKNCKNCQKDSHGTWFKANKNTKGRVISKCSQCQNHACMWKT